MGVAGTSLPATVIGSSISPLGLLADVSAVAGVQCGPLAAAANIHRHELVPLLAVAG